MASARAVKNKHEKDCTRCRGFYRRLPRVCSHRGGSLVKRGNLSRETKSKPEPLIIRARINGSEPEPIRVLRSIKEPELGQIFRGVPIRFRTNLFKRLCALSLCLKKKELMFFLFRIFVLTKLKVQSIINQLKII